MRLPTLPMIPVWLSIAVAIGLRVVLMMVMWRQMGPPGFFVPDSPAYLEFANTLAARGEFENYVGTPEFLRTPGYPALLAIGAMARKGWMFTVQFAMALNLALSAAVVALVYVLARRLFDQRIGGLCALLAAVEPTMMAWSLRLMPETALTFSLVLFAYCAMRALTTAGSGWMMAAAASVAAAAYVKPVAWPLIFVLAAAAFFVPGIGRRRATVFLVVAVLLVAPWHVRNYRRIGHAGFSTAMERNLFFGAAASVMAHQEGRGLRDVQADLVKQEAASVNAASHVRRGLAFVASRPDVVVRNHVVGTMRTLFDPGATEYLRFLGLYSRGGRAALAGEGILGAARVYPLAFWSSLALAIVLSPLVLLAFAGVVRAWRRRDILIATLAFIVLYLTFVSGGSPGTGRMRVPMVPFLILLSAYAVSRRSREAAVHEGAS